MHCILLRRQSALVSSHTGGKVLKKRLSHSAAEIIAVLYN